MSDFDSEIIVFSSPPSLSLEQKKVVQMLASVPSLGFYIGVRVNMQVLK